MAERKQDVDSQADTQPLDYDSDKEVEQYTRCDLCFLKHPDGWYCAACDWHCAWHNCCECYEKIDGVRCYKCDRCSDESTDNESDDD